MKTGEEERMHSRERLKKGPKNLGRHKPRKRMSRQGISCTENII